MSSYVRVALVLLCLVLSATAGAGVGAGEPTIAQTSPPHVHPDEAEDDSDIEAVNDQLSESLLNSIRKSTAALEEGDYDRASRAVGDDYDRRLERFRQVSAETGRANEAAAFEAVRDEQRRFIKAAEAYDETYAEYQEARNAGDDQRARELARELEEHHRETRRAGSSLEAEYDRLESFSDENEEIDLGEERTTVQSIQEDINQRQESIQTVEFTETTLTVEADSTNVSFLEPLVLRGELRTAQGNPIANEEVTFVINERETTVTTDADGQFTLTHRPTMMPLDTEEVTVQYAPADASTYLGSSATVPVSIEQVEPTIEVTDGPEKAAFDKEVTVRGSVAADGAGAANVPVAVEIGGRHLGTATTDENGAYEVTTRVPAEAPSGDSTIDVTIPVSDRAIAGTSTSEPITITETESDLTLNARPAGENELEVAGRLTAEDGAAIAGQPITVQVDGESVTTLETADDGAYEGTVSTDHVDGAGEQSVEVVAVYDTEGNVRSSQTSTTTEVDLGEEAPSGLLGIVSVIVGRLVELFGLDVADLNLGEQSFGLIHWLVLLAFAIGLPIISYPLVQYFGSGGDEDEPDAEKNERPREAPSQPDDEPAPISLDDARTILESDPKRAIEITYMIARTELTGHTDETARTHREFYQLCRSNGFNDEELTALKTLTDQYERAAFAGTSVSTAEAEQTIDAATRLVT